MISEFTGAEANVCVVDGPPRQRQGQYGDYKEGRTDYLIINPEQLVNDWDIISKLPRDFIVADEVQWAKNFAPKRSKRLKRFHATYQWGLTGQPVENRAEEVFSIMQWIDPTVLGRYDTFERAFINRDSWGNVRSYKNLPTLHKLLSEHMVRRTREEVRDQLPSVTGPVPVLVDLDIEGARLYRRIVADLMRDLEEAFAAYGNFSLSSFYAGDSEMSETRGAIMSKLTCLRMLLDSPELLRRSAAHYRGEIAQGNRTGSVYAAELDQAGLLDRCKQTPKLDATVELVCSMLEANPRNKVVIFSSFKDSLALLTAATAKLAGSVIFSGDVGQKQREVVKQQFATDAKTRLFLSSDAGGTGLDLPMANYLISFDLPWSAGAYSQRQSRIIRLSSQFPEVTLISMQIKDSLDEYQDALLGQKQKVANAVTDGKGISSRGNLRLDLQSLTTFLRTKVV
jgi:SNF2 family DNA or RNA helicase